MKIYHLELILKLLLSSIHTMHPKKDTSPTLDELLAAIADNLSKILLATSTNTDRIFEIQNSSRSNSDIIVRQLATQYDLTSTLLTSLATT